MKKLTALLLLLPVLASADSHDAVEIKTGFVTGNDYLEWSAQRQSTYAIGLVDGMFLAPFFSATKSELRPVEDCLTGMSSTQIAAIFDKYLKDNPVRWHEPMHVLGYSAIIEGCD